MNTRGGSLRAHAIVLVFVSLIAACSNDFDVPEVKKEGHLARISGVQPTDGAFADPTDAADYLVDFGTVFAGPQISRALAFSNWGDEPIELIVDDVESPFSVSGGGVIAPRRDGRIVFSWIPGGIGRAEAIVTVRARTLHWTVRLTGLVESHCKPVVPRQLHFGTSIPGSELQARLRIENIGDVHCPLAVGAPEGSAFSLRGPIPNMVPAGGSIALQLVARPDAIGTTEGALPLQIEGQAHRVSLGANVAESCFVVSQPGAFIAEPACGVDEQPLFLRNVCDRQLTVESFELSGGDGFEMIEAPALPMVLSPRDRATFRLAFRPLAEEPGTSSAVATIETELETITRPLTGYVRAPLFVEDRWEQVFRPRIDLLLVVDDSPAMEPYLPQLRSWAGELGAFLEARRIHARAGVTTTSMVATEGCEESGAAGRLLPIDGRKPRYVDSDAGDFGFALAAQLPWSYCSAAPNHGLDAAVRALVALGNAADDPLHPEPNDGNLGFRRPDAGLLVFFVTARDDESTVDPSLWPELTGFGGERAPLLGAEAIFATQDCSFDPSMLRYAATTEAASGVIWTCCDRPWPFSYSFGETATFGLRTRFFLANLPADRDEDGTISEDADRLAVVVDGQPVPATAESGQVVWSYDPEANSVDFTWGLEPREGSAVAIRYPVECR